MTVKSDMPTEKNMAGKGRILIADDEETFLKSTADLLRLRRYECDCAADVSQATELLRRHRYDVLICDIKMSGNLRLELIHQVRETLPAMPIILVTGYPSLQSAIDAIGLSVSAYLVKPVDFDELLSKVQDCLARPRDVRGVDDA